MPMNLRDYPRNWRQISERIRERDGYKCAFCNAPHNALVTRTPGGYWSTEPDMGNGGDTWFTCSGVPVDTAFIADDLACDIEYGPEGQRLPTCRVWTVKVILTCAHILNKHDKHDCRDENLASLCNWCHLHLDQEQHAENRAKTLLKKKQAKFESMAVMPLFDLSEAEACPSKRDTANTYDEGKQFHRLDTGAGTDFGGLLAERY